jgi:cytochrome c-type biogenesis protein CcmE
MKKHEVIVIGVFLLFFFALSAGISFLYPTRKQNLPTQTAGQQMTVQGEVVCMPSKNTAGIQTMGCAIGLKLPDGSYVGLNYIQNDLMAAKFATGDQIEVTGILSDNSITVSSVSVISGNCKKDENCCTKNDDCRYISYTGSCNTPEYVTRVQKEAATQGRRNGEAPPRDNVTCTCERNSCITHN